MLKLLLWACLEKVSLGLIVTRQLREVIISHCALIYIINYSLLLLLHANFIMSPSYYILSSYIDLEILKQLHRIGIVVNGDISDEAYLDKLVDMRMGAVFMVCFINMHAY